MKVRSAPHEGSLSRHGAGAAVGAVVAVGLLAGCSSLGLSDPPTANLGCPKVAIVRDTSKVTQFRAGQGRDLTDVTSRAALVDFQGGCDYGRDGVSVDFSLRLVAERGPALTGNEAVYRYFVAIARPDHSIIAKREFDTSVTFPAGATRAGSEESLTQTIPLPEGEDAGAYQVLLGFQLSPEQLDYNRRQLTR